MAERTVLLDEGGAAAHPVVFGTPSCPRARRGKCVQIENPATGYRLNFGPAEIYGFNEALCALDLRIGLQFDCPNVCFVN